MIALVPLKGFRNGKSRLSSVLKEEERARLACWMMERVLRSLGESRSVERSVLISKDEEARSAAQALGVETFVEESDNLNGALREAIASVVGGDGDRETVEGGARTVLIFPADLPLLRSQDVNAMAALCEETAPCVVAAPSQREEGTNALLLRPADSMAPAFGPDSFNRHCAAAEAQGALLKVYRSPGLGLDIDLPEDLEALRRALDPKARQALSALLSPGPVASP